MRKQKISERSIGGNVIFALVFILFSLYAITLIYPLVWSFFNSLKGRIEFFDNNFGFPKDWLFVNYLEAFEKIKIGDADLLQMFWNSTWLTVGGSVISVFTSSLSAYVVARYNFKLRGFIYSLAIFVMLMPSVGTFPATYKLVNDLGFVNSPLILIMYIGGFGFNFIILYGFFKNISQSYAEAAFIDGAGHFKVFFSVMLPQAKPALLSLGIIAAIGIWNDYMVPYLYLNKYPTLAMGIFRFENLTVYQVNYPLLFAVIIATVLPMIIVFALFQNTIMENTVAGGLKG